MFTDISENSPLICKIVFYVLSWQKGHLTLTQRCSVCYCTCKSSLQSRHHFFRRSIWDQEIVCFLPRKFLSWEIYRWGASESCAQPIGDIVPELIVNRSHFVWLLQWGGAERCGDWHHQGSLKWLLVLTVVSFSHSAS